MQFDMIIVGGGFVGAGLALALRDTHLKIALIDARLPTLNDPRLFALNSTTCQFLKNISVWSQFADFATLIKQVHISKQGQFGAVRLNAHEVGLQALGQVIPAYYIERALNESLENLANVTLLRPAKLIALSQDKQLASLTIEMDGASHELTTPLVFASDGTESTVRKQLDIPTDIIDYRQQAIVCKTQLQRPHHHIAYERFVKTGAIAMLPLKGEHLDDQECATIWSLDETAANELMNLSQDEFLQQLQKAFGYRLGRLKSVSKRHCYPLRMVRAMANNKGSVFLLGNSAHTLHPIAAQGFNLAIYEVALVVEKIKTALAAKSVLTMEMLTTINAQIDKQQSVSIAVSDRLPRIFQDQGLLSVARSLAMLSLDVALPIKREFINHMMGKAGRVPSLLL